MGPRCSFCGTSNEPFRQVEGLFMVPICHRCFAARHAPAAEHPGWMATYERVRPNPDQLLRVVYRRVDDA